MRQTSGPLSRRSAIPAHGSTKPVLLDLFCCAGGAAKGYQRAGFYVVGIDIEPQPNYCGDEFIQGDVLELVDPVDIVFFYDAVHASPPCQGYSDLRHRTGKDYPLLIDPVRDILRESGVPYVIENVEGAPLIDPITLCGTMFPELRVLRHRLFETNFPVRVPPHGKHPLVFTHDKRKAHYGKLNQDESYVQVTGGGNCSIANAKAAMGINWMTKQELNEAIPPAYTEWIGQQLATYVRQPTEAAA